MSVKWRLLDTGYASGSWNIAVDEAIMYHHGKGETPPTIRFYAWDPPAVSIGYFQDLEREINVDQCFPKGISIVRRFTGGRAILHDREVTYSLNVREKNPWISGNVLEAYLKISRCLLRGLEKIGVSAQLNAADTGKQKTPVCFDTPSRYELVAGGRKLVGSAQGRKYGCILQHGSIPLEIDEDKLFSVIKFPDPETRWSMQKDFPNRAVALNETGNKKFSYQEVVRALAGGFGETLGIELEKGELTPGELHTAQVMVNRKYGNEKWVRGGLKNL